VVGCVCVCVCGGGGGGVCVCVCVCVSRAHVWEVKGPEIQAWQTILFPM
jgi:hypothetical protein